MDENDEKLLNDNGWVVECRSPFKIRTKDGGSFASGQGAWMVVYGLKDDNQPSPIYFVLRRANCGTFNMQTGEVGTDIIGVTTDEEYAKSKESVFCYYEPVILLDK